MGFRVIEWDLGDNFFIVTSQNFNQAQIDVYFHEHKIGHATIVTDFVDAEFVTAFELETDFINHRFSNERTLGEAVVKFLIKFPNIVRKPEFRFFITIPETLTTLVKQQYHFEHKNRDDILIRDSSTLPSFTIPENITFTTTVTESMYSDVLVLLQTNAYWQSHLTPERFNLLLQSSQCFLTFRDKKLVGFARVLTDNQHFASLWDVVVKEDVQKQGIGTAMMFHIFSNPNYISIKNWLLFTDTAEALYNKFGFVKETVASRQTPYHKIRLQEVHPLYMSLSIARLNASLRTLTLNPTESQSYLFATKRANLNRFWLPSDDRDSDVIDDKDADFDNMGRPNSPF